MTSVVRIDFETRSECDLKAAGSWLYSKHPTTEVLCYAYKIDDKPICSHFVSEDLYDKFGLEVVRGYQFSLASLPVFEAHNAGFELAIWENQMHPKYGWPELDPERLYCSAAKAAAHGLPRSLDGAAKAMGLDVGKDKEGHALMLKLSKPRPQWKKIGKGNKYFGTKEEFKRLKSYCEQDVEVEYQLSKRLSPLNEFERKTFLLDMKINNRGIHCDRELITKAIELSRLDAIKGNEELAKATWWAVQTTGQTEKIRQYLKNHCDLTLPNMQAETIESALKEDILPKARRVLELRQRHSKSSVKKYAAMIARAGDDDRIRETLLYHGAHTGRWTGMKIQPQNYPRPSLWRFEIETILIPAILEGNTELLESYRGSVSTALSDTLRSALTAAPGNTLVGADYASIEARVLFWLAGETEALDMLRRGEDLYIDMASAIYGVSTSEVTGEQRFVGKSTVLGAGYQMSAPRFASECEKRGIDLTIDMAKRIIDAYRSKYKRVKALWYDVHRTALNALSRPTRTTKGRPLLFGRKGSFLCFQLPSGRLLSYKDPEIRINRFDKKALSHMHVDSKTKKWVRTTTYGGALVENIVQAIARDIMAHAMHRAEEAGYKIILSVHDELIAEVPKGFGSVEEFEKILCDTPTWAKGCPIAAEGWMGERYRK